MSEVEKVVKKLPKLFQKGSVKTPRSFYFSLGDGYPYQGRWVWTASVSSSDGFVPLFYELSEDARYLGVRVKPMVVP